MATVVVPQVTALSAGHPLTAVTARVKQAAANDPVALTVGNGGIELLAGNLAASGSNGVLTVAGIAAVLGNLNSYYAGLSATQKAQIGQIEVQVTPTGLRCTVRQADAATVISTLVSTLNTAANFGPAGT